MTESRGPTLAGKTFLSAAPRAGQSYIAQLEECLRSLREQARAAGLGRANVLMQTVSVSAADRDDYDSKSASGAAALREHYGAVMPATSFVAQLPDQGHQVSVEAVLLPRPDAGEILHRSCGSVAYTVVESPRFTEVYAAGLAERAPWSADASLQCRRAFDAMNDVLQREGMDLSHVVRQWSYIEGLLDLSAARAGVRQRYQAFNECRASCYGQVAFTSGYPAATGIGTRAGGVVLACVALRHDHDTYVMPLSSPLQTDAHGYSQGVLVGDPSSAATSKAPPLFERAKLIVQGNAGTIYISGTAAIRGQDTIPADDVRAQTVTTFKNIDALISLDNLSAHGVEAGPSAPQLAQLRVYVKRARDLPMVRDLCVDHYGDLPSSFVIADICRHELLVEIEGTAQVPVHGVQSMVVP